MKINKTEREVMMILMKSNKDMTGFQIAKQVYEGEPTPKILNRSNYVYKILQSLTMQGMIVRKNSYPVFYRIANHLKNKKNAFSIVLLEVECPHCQERSWIDQWQTTKQCSCLTDDKNPRRFWITKHRLTGRRKII